MSDTVPDRFETARSVADAVLYEGYVLYPYRASSRKNRARFQWGVLAPRTFSEADGGERWSTRTECVVAPAHATMLSVRVRFLQAQHRRIEKVVETGEGDGFVAADHLEVDGVCHMTWDEVIDRMVDVAPLALTSLVGTAHLEPFTLAGGTESEVVHNAGGEVVGRFVRQREQIEGAVRIEAARPDADAPFLKVAVTVENTTAWTTAGNHRDDVMGHSLISAHTMLAVDGGVFVSLLDPPDAAAGAVGACHGDGSYPVLIGDDDRVVLASPIILYDHPEVAPQSPGDLYDSLEIDEILALRVMTLTDEEKSEARGTDPRAAAIIDRCDDMSAETWRALHGQMQPVASWPTPTEGAVRTATDDSEPVAVLWWDPEADAACDPWTESVWICGVEVTKGTAVRLRPSHRADAQDIFLAGLAATVAGVFTDVDGDQHVAVTVDDDPATEELTWQGRFLFFHVDEVEPLIERRPVR